MALSMIQCLVMILGFNFASSGRVLWKLKERVHSVHEQRAEQHLRIMRESHLTEGQIHQKLDHFNSRNTDTLLQKYIVNEAYWKKADGPVFLYISGEGALSKFSLLAGHYVDIAKKHGALLVALEHRFYGSSINPGGLELLNLQHLSSQQALADLAAFHSFISQKYALTDKNIWISFGGSYAGALSAWFRGKFPHLVYGAVASSAPVQAKLDFSAYNKVVAHSLTEEDVGGSYKCLNSVREAFVDLKAALLGGNEMKVVKDFGCCDVPKSPEDWTELVQSVADIFMGSVQYNEEGVMPTIAQICDIMTNQSQVEVYDRLVRLAAMYRAMSKERCLDISHQHTMINLNESTRGSFGYRQWYYQTCTEFGFLIMYADQTCDDASCPFVRTVTLKDHTQLCLQLFEIPEDTLPMNIAFTNQYYGGHQAKTQRVLYINGDIDPWMELSIVHNGTGVDEGRAIVIHGAAHCADMNPAHSRDKPSLRQARKEIERHVVMWLKSAA